MSRFRPLIHGWVFLAATSLAACATPADPGEPEALATPPAAAADVAPPATSPAPPATEDDAMTCLADKGQWAKGNLADEALMAKVKADTGSDRIRVIKPGMAVTMDFREDRLNLDVDADNRVTAVRCG